MGTYVVYENMKTKRRVIIIKKEKDLIQAEYTISNHVCWFKSDYFFSHFEPVFPRFE